MKLLNKINLMLILGSFYVSAEVQESLQEKFSKSKETYIAPCHKLYGNALVDCMDSLDDEMLKIQLYLLASESNQRKLFFEKKLTSPEAYEDFYRRFKTDKEWQIMRNQFSLEERRFFSNIYTKKDQENDVANRKLYRTLKYGGVVGATTACIFLGWIIKSHI